MEWAPVADHVQSWQNRPEVALLAQMGDEIKLGGGGCSSATAHKQNPVAAETLVALAQFNAILASGMHQSLVHEQERSGAS